jgi:hypothetical protein
VRRARKRGREKRCPGTYAGPREPFPGAQRAGAVALLLFVVVVLAVAAARLSAALAVIPRFLHGARTDPAFYSRINDSALFIRKTKSTNYLIFEDNSFYIRY